MRRIISRSIVFGWPRLRTPVISKNETTRKGVASHTSGSSSGTVSMSPTVVVPVRRSIRAPASQDSANSEYDQPALVAVMSLIQSVKVFGGGNCPAMCV